MKIPKGYEVSSIVLEKKILSKDDFEKSNAEVEKFAKDNNMNIENTCNDMQNHIRVWELFVNLDEEWFLFDRWGVKLSTLNVSTTASNGECLK